MEEYIFALCHYFLHLLLQTLLSTASQAASRLHYLTRHSFRPLSRIEPTRALQLDVSVTEKKHGKTGRVKREDHSVHDMKQTFVFLLLSGCPLQHPPPLCPLSSIQPLLEVQNSLSPFSFLSPIPSIFPLTCLHLFHSFCPPFSTIYPPLLPPSLPLSYS